jgi:HPt (histidine-containing phosphotransfer) domain-containing protein
MTHPPIDLEIFADLKEATGDDFVAELVHTFLDEAPGMISELKQAASASDADGYRRAAHSIKSNANTFGATDLAERARTMELDGLPAADVDSVLGALEASLDIAAAELRGLIDD